MKKMPRNQEEIIKLSIKTNMPVRPVPFHFRIIDTVKTALQLPVNFSKILKVFV